VRRRGPVALARVVFKPHFRPWPGLMACGGTHRMSGGLCCSGGGGPPPPPPGGPPCSQDCKGDSVVNSRDSWRPVWQIFAVASWMTWAVQERILICMFGLELPGRYGRISSARQVETRRCTMNGAQDRKDTHRERTVTIVGDGRRHSPVDRGLRTTSPAGRFTYARLPTTRIGAAAVEPSNSF